MVFFRYIGAVVARNPVAITTAIRAIITAAVAFGLDWSAQQVGATILAVEAILAVFTRDAVTPNVHIERKVQERVAQREMAGTTGTGDGMTAR